MAWHSQSMMQVPALQSLLLSVSVVRGLKLGNLNALHTAKSLTKIVKSLAPGHMIYTFALDYDSLS